MTAAKKLLVYQFPACAEQMCSLRQKLREALAQCGQSDTVVNNVVLAVGEACTNIIQHAYGPNDKGDIVLEVEWQNGNSGNKSADKLINKPANTLAHQLADKLAHQSADKLAHQLADKLTDKESRSLVFRLTDFARHKTCAEEMRSRPLDEIRPGGLGCHIINEVMDEVVLKDREAGQGNVLELRKRL